MEEGLGRTTERQREHGLVEEGLERATEGTWVGGGGFREGYRGNMAHGLVEEGLERATEGTWVGGGGFREDHRRNRGWWRRV